MPMDDDTKAHFLRLTGRFVAMDLLLKQALRATPDRLRIIRDAGHAMDRLAKSMDLTGKDDPGFLALGIREYLTEMADNLDI